MLFNYPPWFKIYNTSVVLLGIHDPEHHLVQVQEVVFQVHLILSDLIKTTLINYTRQVVQSCKLLCHIT